MSKNLITTAVVALLASLLGVVIGVGLIGNQSVPLGGSSDSGFNATGSGDFQVDGTTVIDSSGNIDAPITSTTGTFSGTVDVADILTVSDTGSSTLYIGSDAASNNSGCLALGDSSATGTVVYITASGSTVTASTTQPAACQ